MQIVSSPADLIDLTPGWSGDRCDDGRPRVSDDVVERLRLTTIEEAWSVLRRHGHHRQFVGDWHQTHHGTVVTGRAVTAQFLPYRPDLDAAVVAAGAREGYTAGDRQNTWVVDLLQPGDVMVVDLFGKIEDGTMVGDNLGTAVAARTGPGAGAVIDGGVRDEAGLVKLAGVNFFCRGVHPTAIGGVTLAGVNLPTRIGHVTVMPGDVVLGTPTGVIFIPPDLAAEVAETSEDTRIRDVFGKLRLTERTYSSADIDVPAWAGHIEDDFTAWRISGGR